MLDFLFPKKRSDKTREKIDSMQAALSASFSNVKGDINNLYQWVDYFEKRLNYNESSMISINGKENDRLPDVSKLSEKLNELDSSVSRLGELNSHMISTIKSMDQRITALESVKEPANMGVLGTKRHDTRSSIREKIAQKITRRSKDYIKSSIMNLIRRYGEIAAIRIREVIVDEQGLCSKSSFYRILAEIEASGIVKVSSQGKEKSYSLKSSKVTV